MTRNAKRFRCYREALGLTQDELAKILGWGEHTLNPGTLVSRKENGSRVVRTSDLLALECLLRRAGKWKRASERSAN